MKGTSNIRAILLMVITLGIVIQAGCTGLTIGLTTGELRGIVTDARSGKNIQGAYVEAYSRDYYYDDYDIDWDYTDSSGFYRLYLEGGLYDVYFEKSGYHPKVIRDISVTAPFTRSLDVQLTPTATPSPTIEPTVTPTQVDVAYAGKAGQDQVSVFRVMSDGTLEADAGSPVSISAEPAGLAVHRGRSRLYVVTGEEREAGRVTLIDTATLNQIGEPLDLAQVEGRANQAVYYSNGNRLYVSRNSSSPGMIEEMVFSGDNLTQTNLITLTQDDPGPMAINQEDGILFVACPSSDQIISVDLAASVQLAEVPGGVENPVGLVFHPGRDRLHVISGSGMFIRTLNVEDPANITLVGDTPVGRQLLTMALDTQFSRLFTGEVQGTSYRVRTWNVNGDPEPSYGEISDPVFWSNIPPRDMLYLLDPRLLLISLDNHPQGGGIRVYDCSTYPAGQLNHIEGSPFNASSSYNSLAR